MLGLNVAIERGYLEDLHDLRAKFKKVNTRDAASLRAWFLAHPYLTASDMRRVTDMSAKTIFRWRKKAGVNRVAKRYVPQPRPCQARVVIPVVPAGVDKLAWAIANYDKYSMKTVATAIGHDRPGLLRKFRRMGIRLRGVCESVKSVNPCYNKAWVVEHYIRQELTALECSKLANVALYTFAGWLNRFKIRIRGASEYMSYMG